MCTLGSKVKKQDRSKTSSTNLNQVCCCCLVESNYFKVSTLGHIPAANTKCSVLFNEVKNEQGIQWQNCGTNPWSIYSDHFYCVKNASTNQKRVISLVLERDISSPRSCLKTPARQLIFSFITWLYQGMCWRRKYLQRQLGELHLLQIQRWDSPAMIVHFCQLCVTY